MSQVLVSPPPIPSLAMATNIEVVERPTSQLHLSSTTVAGDCELGTVTLQERRTATRLSYLASQHHTSEYNRLKFGPAGAPVAYIPLSIQLPAHVRELKSRQAQSAHKKIWWPADVPGEARNGYRVGVESIRNNLSYCTSDSPQQENIAPRPQSTCTAEPEFDGVPQQLSKPTPPLNHPPSLDLQSELSVAMSSPLSIITIPQLSPHVTLKQRNLTLHAKTSESHPINISSIIPFELLPLISLHLTSTLHTPYMFELPPTLFLDHLTEHTSLQPSDLLRQHPIMRMSNNFVSSHPNGAGPPAPASSPPGIWSKPCPNGIPEHATFAINRSSLSYNEQDRIQSASFQTFALDPETTSQLSSTALNYSKGSCASSDASLLSLSPQERPHSAPPALISPFNILPKALASKVDAAPPPLPELIHAMSSDIVFNSEGASSTQDATACFPRNGNSSLPITRTLNSTPTVAPPPRPILGNMLLSSCPGKKVRLSGPVKGRGAICRDLGHDLRRIKALGVGCIICCLDDDELEFLGASWPQYSEIAQSVGLDVLRIPIPEGLTPITPALLDQYLSYTIHSYTLKGVPILVHCRGGVGRAGLIACCWMLKLGLCGWLNPDLKANDSNGPGLLEHDSDIKVRKEVVDLVERVVAVVRRRRSVKAIETYEQVRFLVEYVEHLESTGS